MREKRQLHLPLLFLAVLFGLFLSLGSQSQAYTTRDLIMNGSYDGNETYLHVGDVEYWKFTLPSDGHVELKANYECRGFCWTLYNADLSKEFFNDYSYEASPTSPETRSWDSYLSKGTYILKVQQLKNIYKNIEGWARFYGTFQSAQTTEGEPNDTFTLATVLLSGSENRLKGALTRTDDVDFYQIYVPTTGQVSIKLNTGIYRQNFVLYNSEREKIFSESVFEGKEESPKLLEYSDSLEAGTYYVKIQKGDISPEGNVGTYYLTYNTSAVTSVKLNKSNLTLTPGKSSKLAATVEPDNAVNKAVSWSSSDSDVVSVEEDGSLYARNPGIAVVTARSTDGTNLSSSCTVKVIPDKVSGLYVVNGKQARTALTLNWYSVSGADGYRVYKYNAKTKKFETYRDTAKTTIRVTKLSPETRYVFRVAAYKKSGKTKLLGTASAKAAGYTTPKRLKATTITSKKILSRRYYGVNVRISWKAVSGASGYRLYYRNSGSRNWYLLKDTKARSYTFNMNRHYTYYFRVAPYRTKNKLTTLGSYSKAVSIYAS